MKLRFDLQFFGGGGGGSATQYRKRDPEPQELQDLRLNLYNKILRDKFIELQKHDTSLTQEAHHDESKSE